jgi:hypothetical protein
MRMLDGSARDFFFRMKDSPRRHPERFVRQLVRAETHISCDALRSFRSKIAFTIACSVTTHLQHARR